MHIKTNKMASKAMDKKAESLSELGSHLNGVFLSIQSITMDGREVEGAKFMRGGDGRLS